MTDSYPRDLVGYGPVPPHAAWPGGARIAVQCVLNYEEGAEANVLDGDPASEIFLSDIANAQPVPGARHMSMEQIYEYGSRAGYGLGWRWINYQHVPEEVERADMARAIEVHRALTGERPLGWYTGRTSPNTRRLVAEEGGFLYDADDYSDDLPFWAREAGGDHLIIPYSLETNDMRFASANMQTGDQFYHYLRDAFDMLYAEGEERPKMMSVGLHCRLAGRPGKIAGLERFLRHAAGHRDVWFCRRIDIARHWREVHPVAS